MSDSFDIFGTKSPSRDSASAPRSFSILVIKRELEHEKYTLSVLKTRLYYRHFYYFFRSNRNFQKSKMTHPVIVISATLNTEKYCTLIKSVTEPKIVRSRALRSPPVIIMR